MGNSNSLESNKSISNNKTRKNSRVKEKYFNRFARKSKDHIYHKNFDNENNLNSEQNLNLNKELAHGIEMSTNEYDWGKTTNLHQRHNKKNVRREGSADTDTARDALLLDETPSPHRGIEKPEIKTYFNDELQRTAKPSSSSSSAAAAGEIHNKNNKKHFKIKSIKNDQQLHGKQQIDIDYQKNTNSFHKSMINKYLIDEIDFQQLMKYDISTNSTLQSTKRSKVNKISPIDKDNKKSLPCGTNVKPQNVATTDDHLTTNNNCNVDEVEHTKKIGDGNLNAASIADGIKDTISCSSNDLKSNEHGTIKNVSFIQNDKDSKKILINKKILDKIKLIKCENNNSDSNVVIIQTDSWKLIEKLQNINIVDRLPITTSENSESFDNCEVVVLKDLSSSDDSIFTDPLTPLGFSTEINKCYISEENICNNNDNNSTNYKNFKLNFLSSQRNKNLQSDIIKKLSISKVKFLNLGNDNNEDNIDSPEQDDLEMAIHLRNKLAQMLSSEEQKNCNNNGENGSMFNVSKSKKVELQNLSSRLPENSTTGQTTIKPTTVDNAGTIASELETLNQQLTPSSSFFGSLTESNVLKKVATFITAEKSGNNVKLLEYQASGKRPSIITEKLDFGSYQKFEGQMLMKWFITSLQNSGLDISEQELYSLTQQYCTNLLTIGVIKQISEKSEMETFNPFQMYQWTHHESPSTSVPISPGRLDADIKWPHSSKTKNSPNKITKSTQSDLIKKKSDTTENYLESLANEFYQINTPPLKSGIGGGDRKVYEIKKSLLNCNTLVELYEVVETLLPDRKPSTILDETMYYNADLNETEVTIYKVENLDQITDTIVKGTDIGIQTSFEENMVCQRCSNLGNNKTVATSPFTETKCVQTVLNNNLNINIPKPPPPPPPPLNMLIPKQIEETPTTTINISPTETANSKISSPSPKPKNTVPIPPPIPPNMGPFPPPSTINPGPLPPPPPPPVPNSCNAVVPPPPPPVQNINNSQKSLNANCPPPPGPLPMPMPDGLWFQANTLRKNAVNPPKPMKPLYWTRIVAPKPIIEEKTDSFQEEEQHQQNEPNKIAAELWQEIEETNLDNIDEFTDLFSRQAVIPKNKPEKKKINQIKTIKILDSKRSQNVGIFSRSLHFDFEEIEHAVYHCDTSIVNLETLQHIMAIKATPEELVQIRDASTDEVPLDVPELFLLRIAQISSSAERISCIVFQAEFDEGAIQVSRKLEVVKHLSLFLTESDDLKLLFSIILTLGNYMNGGNRSRGQADGFGLEILGKLRDVKSKDSKITLLHFIVKTYIDRKRKLGTPLHEVVLPIPDPSDIDKACAVDFIEVKEHISDLNKKLCVFKITTEKVIRESNQENIQPFKSKMEDFIELGTKKIEKQLIKLDVCQEIFLKTMKFYHFIPKSGSMDQCTPGQFFEYWLNFTNDFRDIWKKEITFLSNELIKKMKSQHKIKKNVNNTATVSKPNKVKAGSLKDRLLKKGKFS